MRADADEGEDTADSEGREGAKGSAAAEGASRPAQLARPCRGDRLRFQVLGPVRAWRGDRRLDLGPPQQRAVLAVLLLHEGRPVSVPQLVDALWGEQPPPRAVGTLRTYVSRLRALLEPDRRPRQTARLLVSAGGGYALRVPGRALDSARFEVRLVTARRLRTAGDLAGAYEQLRSALALLEGMALAGLPGPYAQRQRDRLTELCVTAQEELFACVVESGRRAASMAESIAGLRAFAAEHPLRERTQALLMLALHREGRQAEARAVYTATRRTLLAELGAEPGPELRALSEELREGAARSMGSAGSAGSANSPGPRPGPGPAADAAPPPRRPPLTAPTPHVPSQLPPDIADFAGRTEAVAQLEDVLCGAAGGQAPVVATLSGLGGAGKTALAVHVAHTVRPRFPHGQLYVDLQGTDRTPADSGTTLTHFLRALGVAEGAVPDGLEQKAALYRSLLADRRVLVILDNARDGAQVRPLLPGAPGCAVLVTSRARTLALSGARRVDVEVMDEAEALGLLSALVGARRVATDPDAARRLVSACGGLPLAVRIIAARLAARPGRAMADLVARLSDERRRLDELRVGDLGVEATFRLGYEALGPDLAHAFRAFALCSMPTFCRGAAAALLNTTDDEAEAAVEALVDAGLVELHGDDRYRYDDLVGIFARLLGERHDSPRERAAAQRRFLDYVLATVLTAVRLIRPYSIMPELLRQPDSPGRALADADAAHEWLNLAHTWLYAAVERSLDATPGLMSSTVDLLTAWSHALSGTARHRDLEPLVRRALTAARRHGDDLATARTLRLLGAPQHGTGTYRRAECALRENLRPAESSGDPLVSAEAAHERGVVLVAMGRETEALPLLEAARDGFGALGGRAAVIRVLSHTEGAYVALDRPVGADSVIDEAPFRARESGSDGTLALVRYQAGCALPRDGRPRQAAVQLRQAQRQSRLERVPRREALTWARLAYCELAGGGRERAALECAEQALAIEREVGDAFCRGPAQAARGRARLALGEPDRAPRSLLSAQAVLERRGSAEAADVARLLWDLGGAVVGPMGPGPPRPPGPVVPVRDAAEVAPACGYDVVMSLSTRPP
ncbi:AfsR/SARP family transcriptional regulator [Streptomyces inhibens]|uniref:AfsR/SARP family transcriptional regulator n=1 Tax=Streptomyces inhibens TaxID=2293571 RepID=UPI001EE727E9|nr:BTAD domain-containing putative transcriptional regulator [Streptomyces inhibens]UKY53275.1 winged helix-turn-helix domain-containing protein [Streptomyces inhibens]